MTTAYKPPPVSGPPPDGNWPNPPGPTPPRKHRGFRIYLWITSGLALVLALGAVLLFSIGGSSSTTGRMNTASAPTARATVAPATSQPSAAAPATTAPATPDAAAVEAAIDRMALSCLTSDAGEPDAPAFPQPSDPSTSWIDFVNRYAATLPSAPANFTERGYVPVRQTAACVMPAGEGILAPRTEIMPDMSYQAHFTALDPQGSVTGGPGDETRIWTGYLIHTTIHTSSSIPDTYQDNVPTRVRLQLHHFPNAYTTLFATDCQEIQDQC